ncbi:MAG TPA: hypothetical protein DEP42_07035 [Ruminococcaceae bacterium]|nr:hypothetical protein [Oscillospiraceae bacterium]
MVYSCHLRIYKIGNIISINHMQDYIYLSSFLYKTIFGKSTTFNTIASRYIGKNEAALFKHLSLAVLILEMI